jgi:hypothetical protein
VIAKLLGCRSTDARVEHCVMSVQAQCLVLLNEKITSRFQPFEITNKRLDQLADHITTFSLAGIKALKADDGQASTRIGVDAARVLSPGLPTRPRRQKHV